MARALGVCVVLFVGCGGSAHENPTPGDAGTAARGGTSAAGMGGNGGDVAGTGASGGVAGTSGSSGSTGSGGASGSVGRDAGVDACALPADSGNCLASMTRFYFDVAAAECRPFTYGGCGGNDNNFVTLKECQAACDHRADGCRLCDGDGITCTDYDCTLCPATRDADGQACETIGLKCIFLPACGATECTCLAAPSAGVNWKCVPNAC